ncbi:MAG: hypothetical protein IKQ56_07175 [Lachnospiraceae bacterium]|nr:hypothetical protein [Lachnospiraceae bacterium]
MKRKASFTIEASLLLPMIIFSMAHSVEQAVEFHKLVKEVSGVKQDYLELSPEKTIYALRFADTIKDEIGERKN